MAIDIKVPSVGESITEGTIARWLKKDGEPVRAGEPLFELETDKATGEVAAPAAGKLKITVPEGETVAVGAVVGHIEERTQPPSAPPMERAEHANDGKHTETAREPARQQAEAHPEAPLSPAAREIVRKEGVDVHQVAGSGRGGRITKEDVLEHLQHRQTAPPQSTPETPSPREAKAEPVNELPGLSPHRAATTKTNGETRQRMSSIRQRIAERLVAAQRSAAILTTFNEADLSAILSLRSQYRQAFHKKHGIDLGLMPFFVKASIDALRAFPTINAHIDGNDIVYHHYCNIGIAVSTDKGLLVPVLHNAERLSFAGIETTIAGLAEKAHAGKIAVSDLQGGTFTITNGGVFGSLLSTPLLNPPQSGILGMHAIQKRPVAIDDNVVIRPMMYLALSYDHRLVDGREAVGFLVRVKECVEKPERLLLEV